MFFFNFKISIFRVVRGLKGQKMVQNDKNFCLSHLVFQEPYIIWSSFMVHMYVYKDNISRQFFNFFFKILIFRIIRRGRVWGEEVIKGQETTQNEEKLCMSHYVSQEPYIIWLWFLVPMCKMVISPENFFIFQNFDFWGF